MKLHGNCKPALGYPSRSDAAAARRAQGKTLRQIAAELGITVQGVETLMAVHRRRSQAATISLPNDLRTRLIEAARARDTDAESLVQSILHAVLRDDLIAAVLDTEAGG